MKALLLSEYNRLEMVDVPMPRPGPNEVLVRVEACGICGSDVHGYDGSTGRRIPPLVMGHEAAGTVAAIGPHASGVRQGDRVTFDSTVYCGECEYCRHGEMNLCDRRQVLGVATPEYRRAGAFAEYGYRRRSAAANFGCGRRCRARSRGKHADHSGRD